MKYNIEHKIKGTLFLEEDEIRWLKNYLQNSFVELEEEIDTEMRERFFITLKQMLN